VSQPTNPDADAREALRLIGADPPNWVPERPGIDHNVAIIGAGQSGRTFAFALRRAGIGGVTLFDAASKEADIGVWLTCARMHQLRTPKNLPGPELGIPALSFQSWYEARHGAEAYAAIDRIPRTRWAEYLDWYRGILAIPVRFGTRLRRIEPAKGHFRLHLDAQGQSRIETARKIILANGVDGNGEAYIPPLIRERLPPSLYAHTAHAIDFSALRGRTVAVIGAAASAFDAAGVALEAGAAAVHLFARRAKVASLPVIRVRGYPGAYDNYHALPDSVRWHQAIRFRQAGSTPTADAVDRAVKFSNFHLHLASPWTQVQVEEGRIRAHARGEGFLFDFAIAGTGYRVDLTARPELADFADQVLLWRDRFTPSPEERDDDLGRHPYLGAGHEYLERVRGAAPYLKDIHVYNPAGFVSFGLPIGDVPSIKRDVPAVVRSISRDLFFADFDWHQQRINSDIAADFAEDLYASAIWNGAVSVAAE